MSLAVVTNDTPLDLRLDTKPSALARTSGPPSTVLIWSAIWSHMQIMVPHWKKSIPTNKILTIPIIDLIDVRNPLFSLPIPSIHRASLGVVSTTCSSIGESGFTVVSSSSDPSSSITSRCVRRNSLWSKELSNICSSPSTTSCRSSSERDEFIMESSCGSSSSTSLPTKDSDMPDDVDVTTSCEAFSPNTSSRLSVGDSDPGKGSGLTASRLSSSLSSRDKGVAHEQ
mmetsp:Transcript_19763/g.49168  ORF Transcript_19763/g.49168 Transcript_19763/m.49168 type:complete len:227 (-) Transcript_19763:2586-3266(-)